MAENLPGGRRVTISDNRAERGDEATFEVSVTNFESLESVEVESGIETRDRAESIVDDIERASRINQSRSKRAIATDRSKQSAETTLDVDEWASEPGEFDFPGVDSKESGSFY